ncbi:MAG TPA: potassium-transporting ATPase subunit KdpC [Acidobacteriaceae bacterium]
MKKHIVTSLLYTAITAVLLGTVYPLAITGVARLCFADKASGQLIHNQSGDIIGSKLIGQSFTGPLYFHSRPSAAGTGYDAANSSGSNLGPTSKVLADRVAQSISAEHNGSPVPVDLVTASGSGLDPDISPQAARYQVARIAATRGISPDAVRQLVARQLTPRQFGVLGEPRINVLELNLSLDALSGAK